jgi:hypothetical protein
VRTLSPLAKAALVGGALGIMPSALSCASPAPEGKYPPRPEGCAVQMFRDAPSVVSDNIGPVSATCGPDISDEDCLRTLKDQACKLGADIVWGASDTPTMVLGKKQFAGRAAHTKTHGN